MRICVNVSNEFLRISQLSPQRDRITVYVCLTLSIEILDKIPMILVFNGGTKSVIKYIKNINNKFT